MSVNFTDLIFHKKGVVSLGDCEILIKEWESLNSKKGYELEHCYEAITHEDIYSSFKKVELEPNTKAFKIVHDVTEETINQYHDYLDSLNCFHVGFRSALKYSHVYRLLKYETGTKIHKHIDHDPFVYGSCVINLNEDYEGGLFSFFRGKHKVKLGRGDVLIFPADFFWVHEVEEITKGNRYSVNSFLQSIPQAYKEQISKQISDYLPKIENNEFYHKGLKYNIKQKSNS